MKGLKFHRFLANLKIYLHYVVRESLSRQNICLNNYIKSTYSLCNYSDIFTLFIKSLETISEWQCDLERQEFDLLCNLCL